jgi:carbonic anhydrase
MFKLIIITSIVFVSAIYANEAAVSTVHEVTTHQTTSVDPNDILEKVLKGNERFAEGISVHPHLDENTRLKTSREGQKPIVSILSCSDSRVPPEEIFDMGIGDIFAIRVAGNIADKSQIGSLEYGAGHLGTTLIIVLGHTKCGAVTAVVKGDKVGGNILSFIDNIKPAVDSVRRQSKNLSFDEILYNSVKANIWQSIEDILKQSSEIRHLVKSGKVKIVGAIYDIETGKVTNLGVHWHQEQILRAFAK